DNFWSIENRTNPSRLRRFDVPDVTPRGGAASAALLPALGVATEAKFGAIAAGGAGVNIAVLYSRNVVLAVEAFVLDVDGDDDARLEGRVAAAHAVAGDEVHEALLQDRLGDVVGLFLRRHR